MSEDEKKREDLAEGTLMSHLLELRDRLMKGMLALLVLFVPCAIFANELYSFVAQPLLEKLPKGTTLIATNVVSPFMTPFKLALMTCSAIPHRRRSKRRWPSIASSSLRSYRTALRAYA